MWLIGIDEAGYGPKLGPLVVAATAWRWAEPHLSNPATLETEVSVDRITPDPFAPIATPVKVGETTIRVDDSKAVFRGGVLTTLGAIASVSAAAIGRTETTLRQWLPALLPRDFETIRRVAWLVDLAAIANHEIELLQSGRTKLALQQWQTCDWKLIDVAARMIDAASFNRFCGGDKPRGNKSDLLGETSIELAGDLLDAVTVNGQPSVAPKSGNEQDPECVQIFFDRHGGRRYYAGVIQAFFDCEPVRIIDETKTQSVYETVRHGRPVRLHFTVKGDRHVPVALSSLHAKYLREVAMASLNEYFRSAADEAGIDFRPTAGYPVDADRFLTMIRPLMKKMRISDADLIRCR